MGIGGGAGVGGGAQPPQIRESETTAFVETAKKNVAMVHGDTLEVIPFTQAEYDQRFKYRSEPDRPTLHPLLHLRHGSLPELVGEEVALPLYEEFISLLPAEMSEELLRQNRLPFRERDPNFVALDQLLTATARAIVWLNGVTGPVEAGSPEEISNAWNLALPVIALRAGISQAESVCNTARLRLAEIGPNDPSYDSLVYVVGEFIALLPELQALFREIREGGDREALTLRFRQLAAQFDRLAARGENTGPEEKLLILTATLENLAMISSAWALGLDSSPLLIGTYAACTGLSQDASEAGVLGAGFTSVVNGLVEGVLSIFSFGPLAELEELDALDHDLVDLRDA